MLRGGTAKAPVLVAAKTPITVKQLLTHTSGYIYGFGKDPMRLKLEPEADTYWIRREPPGPPPESLKNQF